MKTIITITNCTKVIEEFAKKFSIKQLPLEEIIQSDNPNGIFLIKENTIDKVVDANVINIFISESDLNPLYDLSLPEEKAKDLIVDLYSSKDLPYCELTGMQFKRQKVETNDCMHCFVKCDRRMHPYERNEAIDAIFDAWCRNVYETYKGDYKQVQVATAKGWPIDADVETFQKYAMNEEKLFHEFLETDFNAFVIMAPLIKKEIPQYLNYYFAHRRFSFKELVVDKYTVPW